MWHTAKKSTIFAKKQKLIIIKFGMLGIDPAEHVSHFSNEKRNVFYANIGLFW